MKYPALLALTLSTAFLAACGGGDGGGGGGNTAVGSDVFQSLIANVFTGGYLSVNNDASDDTNSSGSGCGYRGAVPDLATVEKKVLDLGGSITKSIPTQWCGTAGGESNCISQIDRTFVIDSRSPQKNTVEIFMTGLLADRMTVVNFDSLTYTFGNYGPLASVRTLTRDPSRSNSNACPTGTSQPTGAIDGNWTGYKATYSPSTITGSTVAITVACVSQKCTVSDSPSTTLTLSQSTLGNWRTATGAPKLAGASISDDRQLLSMFVCNAPLNEAQTFENCSFYTLKR